LQILNAVDLNQTLKTNSHHAVGPAGRPTHSGGPGLCLAGGKQRRGNAITLVGFERLAVKAKGQRRTLDIR